MLTVIPERTRHGYECKTLHGGWLEGELVIQRRCADKKEKVLIWFV